MNLGIRETKAKGINANATNPGSEMQLVSLNKFCFLIVNGYNAEGTHRKIKVIVDTNN